MIYLESRKDLVKLIKSGSKVIEVGVFKGDFSKDIFDSCGPSELVLIDIFEGIMGSGDKDGNNMQYIDLNDYFLHLSDFFSEISEVKLIKGKSSEVLKNLNKNSYDFIYIDASHEYNDVKIDLFLSYDLIKPGGYISGHDYEINRFPGVVKAVEEFCQQNNQNIEYLTKDGLPSFAIKINK
jgi:ubiquinone/menaquinone biosynthesis C-methylase UbiE